MAKSTLNVPSPSSFDAHAVAIAKRQYFQPSEQTVEDMFRRVAAWVAGPEAPEQRTHYEQRFYELMVGKRFCPGGRVLAGAATSHGNVLNCFVQDGSPEKEGTTAWVLRLAMKLALVTKVGGGNGLNLDPIKPKRPYPKRAGTLYLTIRADHPDYEKVKTGTYMDLVHGKYVTRGYRYAQFVEAEEAPAVPALTVGDSVESIWQHAAEMATRLMDGENVLLSLSELRPEGTPVKGSGGTSSGPSSFAVEVFDNFAYWASLGGAEYAGPVATLRYIFAPTLRVIRQGGCLHPDTLVHTSRGTLRLREFVDPYQYGWQEHHLQVATDEGWKESPRGYNNGVAATLKVTLASGQEIQGTPNHKLKVMREDGRREWVELKDLKAGDYVIQVLDQHTGAPVLLSPLDEASLHHNSKRIRTPEVLNETLAFFLGYFWGDGFVSDGRVGLAVAHDSPMMARVPELFRELFGLEVSCEQKPNDKSVVFVTKSAALVAWLKQNGFEKGKARMLELPRAVRQAPRPVVGAFLRGLYEADGTMTHGYPELVSASKQLLQDVMVMLGGLGIPAKLTRSAPNETRYSKHASYRLRVVSSKGLERYLERVGVMAGSRFEALYAVRPDTRRESAWPLPHAAALLRSTFEALPAGAKGRPSAFTPVRKTLSRYLRGERTLTVTGFTSLKRDPLVAAKLPEFDYSEYYVPVKSVTPGGRILTLDLSVDENCTYLANGAVSHNTRRGAGMATMSITHPDIKDFITAKDLHREKEEGDISTFNISVLVGDDFMHRAKTMSGMLYEIADHAWQTGEPGLIFIDRINQFNPMRQAYGEIKATNPCGEIPLFPGEPCDLGAINLAQYVTTPNIGTDGFDWDAFRQDVATCIRFLDNVLDVNTFALEDNREMSMRLRRLGLGVMGLADALIKMGYRYDSEAGRGAVARMIAELREQATRASEALAQERGAFPDFPKSTLAVERRNVALLTVAPTGTTSMLMGVSSGIEPVFAPFIYRRVGTEYKSLIHPLFQELLAQHPPHPDYAKDGSWDWEKVVAAVQANHGSVQGLAFIPDAVRAVLVCAHDITPEDHVKMQGVVQTTFDAGGKMVGNSISKTINMPHEATVQDVFEAYSLAFETGCKGITVYRDGSREFQVLSTSTERTKSSDKENTAAMTKTASQPTRSVAERLPGEPLFDRPARLTGFTDAVKLTLPTGEKRGFYVTVNKQDGLPTEVFIVSGKAGDEANADAEALGRLTSIALQYGVPAEAIVKTLRGINGGMYGTYQGRMVMSKADLIAVALETAGVENVLQRGAKCPDCGGPLRFEEGCHKCEACGYSKCG